MTSTTTTHQHIQHHYHRTREDKTRIINRRSILGEYAQRKKDVTLGYLSFFSIVWFLLSPMIMALFVISYFGFVYAVAFICVCILYNYFENTVHPKGLVGRKWKAFHDFMGYLWAPFQNMMPIKVIKLKSDEFHAPRKFLFCFHPHGILFLGPATIGNTFDKMFPGLDCYHLMSTVCFLSPIFRQYTLWNGCIPATKECASTAVNEHGVSLSVIPGGLAEMLESDPTPRSLLDFEVKSGINSNPNDDGTAEIKTVTLYMQSRKGFIKLAMQQGLDLVPVFTFGEIDTFHQMRWGLSWRRKLSRFLTIPVTFIWGKFFLFPIPTPLNMVVGIPIVVEKEENPPHDSVEKLHRKYMEELCKLFEGNKAKYGYENARLLIM